MTQQVASETASFPPARTCPFDPPPEYGQLRGEAPISRVSMAGGDMAWLVTRYEDVRTVLSDPRMSSDRRKPGFPKFVPGQQPPAVISQPMIGMDAPEHTAARRGVLGEFTVRRTEALRPRIQQIVDDFIDQMLDSGGPVDLVQALSLPVPSLVICELLGVPYADHDFFQAHTSQLIKRSTPNEERQLSVVAIRDYLDSLVSAKEEAPTDDLLGRQITKQRTDSGEVDHDALVSMAFLLLIAGHETTANMISLGTVGLLENPGQLAEIKADPAKTPAAVEELLRYFSIVEFATSRTALEDLDLGGVRIRAGEGVIALGPSANRDADVFERPDALDIDRGARHHVAFGYGPHQCLGQNLARMELQIVFDTLFHRIPDLRLAVELSEVPFKDDANIYGIHELQVTW